MPAHTQSSSYINNYITLLIPILLSLLHHALFVESASVQVVTHASWNSTCLALEASELISEPALYWKYMDYLIQYHQHSPINTDAAQYQFATTTLQRLMGNYTYSHFLLSLHLRAGSPAIASAHQMRKSTILSYLSLSVKEDAYEDDIDDDFYKFDHCSNLIVFQSSLTCDVASLQYNVHAQSGKLQHEHIYTFDHVHPSSQNIPNNIIILYGDPLSPKFASIHAHLIQFAQEHQLAYVLRPYSAHTINSAKLSVPAFAVDLSIKNMEYKVLDDKTIETSNDFNTQLPDDEDEREVRGFIFKKLHQRYESEIAGLKQFESALLAEQVAEESKKMNIWDIKDIGYQVSQKILRHREPLQMLREISTNFPMYAQAITHIKLNRTIKSAIEKHHQKHLLGPGTNYFSINGISMDVEKEDQLDIYTILNVLNSETSLIDSLHSLRLPAEKIRDLLGFNPAESYDGFLLNMDVYSSETRRILFWMNNLEKDAKYRSWANTVMELTQQSWQSQLKYIRKNLYNGIILVDPTSRAGLQLFSQARFFVNSNAPIRFGVVFHLNKIKKSHVAERAKWNDEYIEKTKDWEDYYVENDDDEFEDISSTLGAYIAKLFFHIKKESSLEHAFDFLQTLADMHSDMNEPTVDHAFNTIARQISLKRTKLKEIQDDYAYNEQVQLSYDYVYNRNLPSPSTQALMVINGVLYHVPHADAFREIMMNAIYAEQYKMMVRAYNGEINDRMEIVKFIQGRANSFPRMSPQILKNKDDMKYLKSLPSVVVPSKNPAPDVYATPYLHSPDEEKKDEIAGTTLWVVADWTTHHGLTLVNTVLDYLKKGHGEYDSRAAFFHITSSPSTYYAGRLASLIQHKLPPHVAHLHIRQIVMLARHLYGIGDGSLLRQALLRLISQHEVLKQFEAAMLDTTISIHEGLGLNPSLSPSYLSNSVEIAPNNSVLIINGRIIDIQPQTSASDIFLDLKLAVQLEYSSHKLDVLIENLQRTMFHGLTGKMVSSEWLSEVVFRVNFGLAKRQSGRSQPFPHYDRNNVNAMVKFDDPKALIHINVVIDPLSKIAQKLSSILIILKDMFPCSLHLFFNPKSGITEFPLKRFYRYALPSHLSFDDAGALKPFTGALFRNLQTKQVLSTIVSTPETWQIALEMSKYDLDNLRLSDIGDGLFYVQYQIEHLLVAGQCVDQSKNEPPSGLQLVLNSFSAPYASDTVVMQNLGYFQLKANPGVWDIKLADNRHSEIYQILGGNLTRPVFVRSFNDPATRLEVARRPGHFDSMLLDPSYRRRGGSLSSSMGEKRHGAASIHDNTIHIFSLASGHLYERFLKIMILSVIKSTKSPVKFWFIKNFASPQFVEFLPQMAKHYGFEAEFVTYKWPMWLRRQEEKQRIIWGYKILFLDVLFPLAVPRIIYIDADQVVRGDVKELWDMDLQGAPYAYTPFCDSNKDTEGFRFWKQGYWKDHLRGKPYHISALYVVDLDQFRLMRAGDSLRGIYDNLSADPNSLANLDQDLPNYAQSMVPIYSLPQEWLWCQTWCSMDTLNKAKTIDLCNNPLTKTPKLDVAKSLLPEWVGFDTEASNLDPIFKRSAQTLQEQVQHDNKQEAKKSGVTHDEL